MSIKTSFLLLITTPTSDKKNKTMDFASDSSNESSCSNSAKKINIYTDSLVHLIVINEIIFVSKVKNLAVTVNLIHIMSYFNLS